MRQRSAEVAVRSMLGASPASLRRLLLLAGLRPVLLGAAVGLAAALAAGRLLAGQLYGIEAADPLVLGLAVATMFGAALLACYLPARRSTRREGWALLRES